jgi:uncharacterized protein YbjT (DUF2867 family)
MRYPRILVIGGSGFLGRSLVAKLCASGRQVIVPTRRRERARHLLVLPTVDVVTADVAQPAILKSMVGRVDAVINLVGVLHSKPGMPYGPQFAHAHVELPRRIADACTGTGVQRLIHVSALGVREGGKANMPSGYLRSKAAGEQVLRTRKNLELTIVRPSVVFGVDDRFTNLFAKLARLAPILPVAKANATLQPVHSADVAQAIIHILENTDSVGKTFELAGPDVLTLGLIVRLTSEWSGHPRPVLRLPDFLGSLQALLAGCLPGEPLITRDNTSHPGFDKLGIEPATLATIAPRYLSQGTDLHSLARARASR